MDKYKLIKSSCSHYPFANTVSIFPCCDKAYNCYKCHEDNEKHALKPASSGYCIKCTEYYDKSNKTVKKCEYCGIDF